MITLEKLAIYEKYNGDIDGWVRIGPASEKKSMNDSDWYIISEIVSMLVNIRRGSTSGDFGKRTLADIQRECENSEVLERLDKLSKQLDEQS